MYSFSRMYPCNAGAHKYADYLVSITLMTNGIYHGSLAALVKNKLPDLS